MRWGASALHKGRTSVISGSSVSSIQSFNLHEGLYKSVNNLVGNQFVPLLVGTAIYQLERYPIADGIIKECYIEATLALAGQFLQNHVAAFYGWI